MKLLIKFYAINHSYFHHLIPLTNGALKSTHVKNTNYMESITINIIYFLRSILVATFAWARVLRKVIDLHCS